jgi:diadenosine tetraphosphate (Ap4A) HIT family hydrolase
MSCLFCNACNEYEIFKNNLYRIIKVQNDDYPLYFQLIINQHIKELSDLQYFDAIKIFNVIYLLDKSICEIYQVDKINIASLGNVVPHLHWHIIGRYKHDKHFPNSIWGNITNKDYKPNLEISNISLIQLKEKLTSNEKICSFEMPLRIFDY